MRYGMTLTEPKMKYAPNPMAAGRQIGIPAQTIRNWIKRGVAPPPTVQGHDCWKLWQIAKNLIEAKASGGSEAKRERRDASQLERKRRLEADRTEIIVEQLRGELFDSDSVRAAFNEIFGVVTSGLSSLAMKLGPELEGLTRGDITRRIDEEVRRVCEAARQRADKIQMLHPRADQRETGESQ